MLGPLLACLVGCSPETGMVELNWVFVDREGTPIYPGGQFSINRFEDSCDLPGRTSSGEALRYDLEVELLLCDPGCEGGCGDPSCQVVEPLGFSCTTARGADPDIPASADPYQFAVRTVIVPEDGSACRNLPPTCIAVPGPRNRLVRPGLTTDLQVYQIALDVDASLSTDRPAARLDLEACGCV